MTRFCSPYFYKELKGINKRTHSCACTALLWNPSAVTIKFSYSRYLFSHLKTTCSCSFICVFQIMWMSTYVDVKTKTIKTIIWLWVIVPKKFLHAKHLRAVVHGLRRAEGEGDRQQLHVHVYTLGELKIIRCCSCSHLPRTICILAVYPYNSLAGIS